MLHPRDRLHPPRRLGPELQAALWRVSQHVGIGGDDYSTGTPSATNAAYQLLNGLWKTVGTMPFAGFAQKPVFAGGKLYLLGGHDAAHNVLSGIWQAS